MIIFPYNYFPGRPANFLYCSDPDFSTTISCIIVDDKPAFYSGVLQDILHRGIARMAMTIPFCDEALDLLRGRDILLGADDRCFRVRIPSLINCILIVDLENGVHKSSGFTFNNYNADDYLDAGLQFYRQLGGFPGRFFFTSRRGVDELSKIGIPSSMGIVKFRADNDYNDVMSRDDRASLLKALFVNRVGLDCFARSLIDCSNNMLSEKQKANDYAGVIDSFLLHTEDGTSASGSAHYPPPPALESVKAPYYSNNVELVKA